MKRFSCVPAAAVFDPRLTPVLRRTLEALGLFTDKNGQCHVKIATLAAILATDPRNVKRYLRRLEGFGYVRTTPQFRAHGGQRENTYELVLGGWSGLTTPGVVEADHPHKERVLEGGTTAGRAGGEVAEMNNPADPCNDGLVPTGGKTPKKCGTKRMNAVTLAADFVNMARTLQFGHPTPATHVQMRGAFRRWHDQGVDYRTIERAIQLFRDAWSPDIQAPAGKLFIKQAEQWIAAARDDIYAEELPKIQEINVEMWERVYADLDAWVADHPEATTEERSAMKAALWQHWKREPKYAVAYA